MAYALQITTQLNMLVRFSTEFENSFNSVERVLEYSKLESEAPRKLDPPPPNWPDRGGIVFEKLFMSYRKGLPPVLKGISLVIQPRQKVGVVGRTGAGKSSMFQALFRIVEPTSGTITFDGVDITTLV
jgi:ABC-type multidrug transport system fused ATPase/permease subunit